MAAIPQTPIARVALAIAGFCVSATLLSWVTLDRIKYLYLSNRSAGLAGKALASLTAADVALLACAAIFAIAILVWGFRDQALVRLFLGEAPAWLFVATCALLVWLGHAAMARGLLMTGDAGTHVARVAHLAAALRGGDSLYWDNYFFGGSTLLQFTGPVFHWAAAAVTLVVGDPTLAIKIVASLARGLAALFAYLLVRKIGIGRSAACLTAILYAGSFQVTYMESIRSSFPQLINFAAMPAILFGIECCWARPAIFGPAAAGIALAATFLIGCHQPTAMIFAGYAAVFVAARIAMDRRRLSALPALLAAAAATALGSCFFLLPFALERGMTADNFAAGSLIGLALPTAGEIRTFFVWGSAGQGAEYGTYLGLPMLLLCGVGGVFAASGRGSVDLRRMWLLFFGLAAISLVVRGAYVRQVTFTLVFLCGAAGMGAEMLTAALPRWRALPLLLFAAVLLDEAPLAIQPWTRDDMHGILAAADSLAQRAATSRVMEVSYWDGKPQVSVGPDSSPLAYARIQMLSGPHKQDATPAHNAAAAVLKIADADLKAAGALGSTARGLLAIENVGWVVGTGPTAPGLPASFVQTTPDLVIGSYWRIPEATPFLVSARLEQAERPDSFGVAPFWNGSFDTDTGEAADAIQAVKKFYADTGVDLATRQAQTFILPVIPAGPDWQIQPGGAPIAHLLSYSVEPGRVSLDLESDRPGFVRLAHPYAATVHVRRDGVPVTATGDITSTIVLPIHAGANVIVVTGTPTLLRQVSLAITGATVLAMAALLSAGMAGRYKPGPRAL